MFGTDNASPYVKDGINNYVVQGESQCRQPRKNGNEVCGKLSLEFRFRSDGHYPSAAKQSGARCHGRSLQELFRNHAEPDKSEADEFYRAITPERVNKDEALVMRQALAGMLWSKQYFFFDVDKWLSEHGEDPMKPGGRPMRNSEWFHMVNQHIISMPDKWEYPWFAAWDLAFHTIALSTVDVDFAKGQLDLMLQESFLHPTGQIPAYEWNFGDVNPPVHAWATIFLYRTEQALRGQK